MYKNCNFKPFCYKLYKKCVTEKRIYVNKGSNLLNPYFLKVLLSFNKWKSAPLSSCLSDKLEILHNSTSVSILSQVMLQLCSVPKLRYIWVMDYVREGDIQGHSLVFLKAHCPCRD